ncbi:FtsH protease activity modulator HflK [Verrucomicrobiales bacterium]|nr:FtsH protease activity modulator HflK [Verrucomicrobiales bacterium]MDB4662470.1 FtsH protease activity modulator HflK [Verrucomicrobiales bacterium]
MIRIQIGKDVHEIPTPDFGGVGVAVILGAIVLIGAVLTSFYTIQQDEQGVVLRFGKEIKTVDNGLHFRAPFWIDTVEKVAVKRQMKQEFGFGTTGGSNYSQMSSRTEQEEEKSMVTGDLNAALVEWVIQYRIENPSQYLFNVRNADDTLRDASESVMREVVGDRTVDEVITFGRQDIESEAKQKLSDLAKKFEMGISIDQVQLKNVNPPQKVQSSFNEVNQAQQDREKTINVSLGEANKVVPKASGEAEQKISEAEGYALQRVNEAEGDAAKFNALFTEYQKAPEVTKRRLYLETMQKVMPQLGKKIIIDEGATGILPLLNLNENATPTLSK